MPETAVEQQAIMIRDLAIDADGDVVGLEAN